jgi:phosphosulfolactate synthase (CoM biosynthesis protein A)
MSEELTIAYMKGVEDGKDKARDRIATLEAQLASRDARQKAAVEFLRKHADDESYPGPVRSAYTYSVEAVEKYASLTEATVSNAFTVPSSGALINGRYALSRVADMISEGSTQFSHLGTESKVHDDVCDACDLLHRIGEEVGAGTYRLVKLTTKEGTDV